MKKFYLLSLMALAAASASAATPSPRMADLPTPLRLKHSLKSASTMKHAPAKADEVSWGEWEMAGTGTFTLDDGFEAFLGMPEWSGSFDGINVYSRTSTTDSSTMQYKLEGVYNDADLIIDYDANTGLCKVMPQPTNIDYFDTPLEVVDAGTVFALYGEEWQDMSPEDVQYIAEYYWDYNYYVPELGKFYLYLSYITEGIDDVVCLTDCSFQFDGVEDMSVSVEANAFYKDASDMKAMISFPESVPLCRYGCFEGVMTQDKLVAILSNAEGVKSLTESAQVDLDSSKGPGMYTLVAVSFSENGTAVELGYAEYTYTPSSSEGWNSLGNGTFTTDMFESLFGITIAPYEVEVQQNIENPALIRVVNPYGENCPFPYESLRADGYDIYLTFDTSNPDQVFFKPTNLGIDMGGGWWIACNYGYFAKELQGGKPAATAYGKYADDVISFPAKSVLVTCENMKLFGGEDGTWYYGNGSGTLSLKVPSQSGVESVSGTSAELPMYYNMQGVKVDAPAAGSIVIERRGDAVAKKIIR